MEQLPAGCSGKHVFWFLQSFGGEATDILKEKQAFVDGRKPSAPHSLLITFRAIVVLSCKRRQCRQAGRQRKKKRAEGRGEEGAGWLQGERGGKNGWGTACMPTSAPTAGLGSSAAVSVLVLRVLPGPGS